MSQTSMPSPRRLFFIGVFAYLVCVAIGSFLYAREPRPTGLLAAITIGNIVAAVVFIVGMVRMGRANKELERMLFAETTSTAFFVTMAAALTYSLIEAWLDAPRLSMWMVWTIGMCTWGLLTFVLKRRYL